MRQGQNTAGRFLSVQIIKPQKIHWIGCFSGKTAAIVLTALNKMGLKDYSQWLSGAKITFSGWNAGEPAQLATENCGAFQ
jgi:3-mercaptopyruvate sulfurtransferase SseA